MTGCAEADLLRTNRRVGLSGVVQRHEFRNVRKLGGLRRFACAGVKGHGLRPQVTTPAERAARSDLFCAGAAALGLCGSRRGLRRRRFFGLGLGGLGGRARTGEHGIEQLRLFQILL